MASMCEISLIAFHLQGQLAMIIRLHILIYCSGAGYRFTATITKGVKKMELTGTASSKLAVQGIRINAANIERDSSLYRGPVFNELDPTLQVG